MPRPKRQRRRQWLRSPALGVLGRLYRLGGARGCRRTGVYDGGPASGFWSGVGPSLHCSRRLIHCRLPHPTAHRFLFPPHDAPSLAIAPRSLAHPLRRPCVSFVLLIDAVSRSLSRYPSHPLEIISAILSEAYGRLGKRVKPNAARIDAAVLVHALVHSRRI